MPRVSVILTSFNHGKYIREAIDSVLAQTFADFELIVWDDASGDDSWSIICGYEDPRIKKFRNDETRRGIYGINKAISEVAAGEYIAIHHSDDVWEPEKLERQVAFLDAHAEYGAVFTNALAIGEDSAPLDDPEHYYSAIFDQPNRSRHEWLNYFFYKGNALCHPSVLIRKRCYGDCGLYRPGLAQVGDFHMWVRLCLKHEIHVMPDRLVRFRVRENEANASGNRPDARIRTITEYHQVLKCYLQVDSCAEMAVIFPEGREYLPADGCDPRFALAMISLAESTYHWTKFFGIELLFDLIADPVCASRIKTLYDFDYRNLVALTGKFDAFLMLYAMDCQKEIDVLKEERDVARSECRSLKARSVELQSKCDSLQSEHDSLRSRHDSLQSRHDSLQSRHDSLQSRHGSLELECTALRAERDSVYASFSWRVTRPLRFVRSLFRR